MTQYSSLVGKIDTNKDLYGDQHPVQSNLLNQRSALTKSILDRSVQLLGERLSIEMVNNISRVNSAENVSSDTIISLITNRSALEEKKVNTMKF